MKANLEQLEEMQKQLFNKQCYLDIQKAMVKHFIKNEKAKQLTLTDVSQRSELLVCNDNQFINASTLQGKAMKKCLKCGKYTQAN